MSNEEADATGPAPEAVTPGVGGLDDTPTVTHASGEPGPTRVVAEPYLPPVELAPQSPLTDDDPVRVGDFWLDARLTASPAGMAFVGHEDGGDSVMVLLLSEGAAGDAAARSRFSGEINAMHIDTVVARGGENQEEGRLGVRYRGEEDDPQLDRHQPLAPWAALAFDGSLRAVGEAERVLHAIDLSRTPPLSKPAGPEYMLHWTGKTGHGTTRLWPLPWPGRKDRGGWITMLTSFLLMLLLTAVALLLAILVFQNQPLVNAPQPIPSPASGSGSGSGSPQSGSGSGSPSPQSGSPSGTQSSGDGGGPYSHSPSMVQPSGDSSGPGDPKPNPKL